MLLYKWFYGNSDANFLRVCRIRQSVFVEEQGVALNDEIDQYESDSWHLLVVQDDNPIATCRVRPDDNQSLKLQRVAVLKPNRGHKIGSHLMMEVERWAIENHFNNIYFSAQDHAIPFYEKLGYTISDPNGFLECDIPHHNMRKILKNKEV